MNTHPTKLSFYPARKAHRVALPVRVAKREGLHLIVAAKTRGGWMAVAAENGGKLLRLEAHLMRPSGRTAIYRQELSDSSAALLVARMLTNRGVIFASHFQIGLLVLLLDSKATADGTSPTLEMEASRWARN